MKKVTLIKKIVSIILTGVFILTPSLSIAGSVSPLSDSLSTIKISELADHTIQFLAETGVQDNSETITITFASFDLITQPIAFGDIDIATSTTDCTAPTFTEVTVAAAAADGVWGVSTSSQRITIAAPTNIATAGSVTAGTCMRIRIGDNATGGASNNQITNPTAGDYTIAVAGTFADTGTTTITIIDDDQVQLTADVPQSITFSISESAAAFGTLNTTAVRYATTTGSNTSESIAHLVEVGTNASGGYTLTVEGATLTLGAYTISPIGTTNTASNPTTGEQFGFKAVASGGSGTVDGTYTGGGYGYDGNNGADTVATHDAPDSTTYSITYIANVDAETEAGAYSTALTFVGTANY